MAGDGQARLGSTGSSLKGCGVPVASSGTMAIRAVWSLTEVTLSSTARPATDRAVAFAFCAASGTHAAIVKYSVAARAQPVHLELNPIQQRSTTYRTAASSKPVLAYTGIPFPQEKLS